MQPKRLYNLDYLRGLAAFGIMIYHYILFSYSKTLTADEFLGRVGIYGVVLFYILSGLTLFYVYSTKMEPTKSDLISFAKKRFFRIFPLLWLATIATIILNNNFPHTGANDSIYEISKWLAHIFLNFSGLFGLIKRDSYLAAGAWSIGNELVFYIFFPVFIALKNKSKVTLGIFSVFILALFLYFSFSGLRANNPLSDQWMIYINPLNQVFLFLGGFLIGMLFKNIKIPKTAIFISLIAGLLLFVFFPASGNQISLVTGVARLVFTLSCFLIVFSFYKIDINFPKIIDKPLALLGESSYSVYLLHPLVLIVVNMIYKNFLVQLVYLSKLDIIILSVVVTLPLSYFVYKKFEKYFMELGKTRMQLPHTIADFQKSEI